jgi:hypothetical protein
MKKISTIVITSREPFNTEGNSHMHYVDELKKSHRILFVDPPESWPCKRFSVQQKEPNVVLVPYFNVFPMFILPRFFGKLNDWFTALRIGFLLKRSQFILWQFDPYYLSSLGLLRPRRKIYFPLDYYGRDIRDKKFAKRADLLVTVNSLFVKRGYANLNKNLLLLPHGFSSVQLIKDEERNQIEEIKAKYGNYFIFTGTLTQWLDYSLLEKVAREIRPLNLLLLGKQYVEDEKLAPLKSLQNVRFLGHVSYRRLKYYVAPAQACLVLYNFESEGSRNPIKITDYISQNKLVINTLKVADLQPLEGKIIYTAQNQEEYIQLVKDCIGKQLTIDKAVVDYWKSANTYPKLVKRIFEALRF